MIRVILFLLIIVIIALIACLFAFWRVFCKFREISIYNDKTFLETIKTDREVIKNLEKDISRLEDKLKALN